MVRFVEMRMAYEEEKSCSQELKALLEELEIEGEVHSPGSAKKKLTETVLNLQLALGR